MIPAVFPCTVFPLLKALHLFQPGLWVTTPQFGIGIEINGIYVFGFADPSARNARLLCIKNNDGRSDRLAFSYLITSHPCPFTSPDFGPILNLTYAGDGKP